MAKRRNPMTEQETADFEKRLLEIWRTVYNKAINSGAFPDEYFEFGDHTMAEIAAVVMGDEFSFNSQDKKLLDNFRKF